MPHTPFVVVRGNSPEKLTEELLRVAAMGYEPMPGGLTGNGGAVWVICMAREGVDPAAIASDTADAIEAQAEQTANAQIAAAKARANAIREGNQIPPNAPPGLSGTPAAAAQPTAGAPAQPGAVPQNPTSSDGYTPTPHG